MADRYPGYDVLTKRNSMSWNDKTRAVIDAAAGDRSRPRTVSSPMTEWQTLRALCDRIIPQPAARPHPAPLAAMIDEKAAGATCQRWLSRRRLPPLQEAWRRGLAALDAEAHAAPRPAFHDLAPVEQDALLTAIQKGDVRDPTWGDMPPKSCSSEKRVLHDIVSAYYAHPTAWNEIGFGGPAAPRGYVRMDFDRRDPWEASEARPGREEQGPPGERPCRMTPRAHRAPSAAARPTCFVVAAGCRCGNTPRRSGRFRHRRHRRRRRHAGLQARRVRLFGRGARRRSVLAAAGGFRLRRAPPGQALLDRRAHRRRRQSDAARAPTIRGKSVGGSTVHFAMVSLRFRPEWFKARTKLGYGADWPLDWREMWRYYAEVEAGAEDFRPGDLSVGTEAAALSLPAARAQCRRAGAGARRRSAWHRMDARRRSRRSRRRAAVPPCVYRGMCVIGCSTNAKQSVLITWLPRALAAGAEIRDLAMVGRIEHDDAGRVTGVHYHRDGRWRFQRARNVVVAGYAIETPRLLLNSATSRFPDGLANSSGPRRQESDGAVQPGGMGHHGARNPLLQRPALARHHRALELHRRRQGFLRRLRLHEPGAAADDLGGHAIDASAACGASRCSTRWRNTTTRSA